MHPDAALFYYNTYWTGEKKRMKDLHTSVIVRLLNTNNDPKKVQIPHGNCNMT